LSDVLKDLTPPLITEYYIYTFILT